MSRDNRLSAALSTASIAAIGQALLAIRGELPFLLSLVPAERKELPRLGEKTFEKCLHYMQSNPEFLPGFVQVDEVQKDRDLRAQLLRFNADLQSLAQQLDDTLTVLGSEVLMADLAYYQSAREAARRGRPGAEVIYQDLRSRFPGAGAATAKPQA